MRFLLFGLLCFTLGCSPQSVPAVKVAPATPTVAKLTSAPIHGPASPAWSDREVEVLELLFYDRYKEIKKTEESLLVIHADTVAYGLNEYVPDSTEDSGTLEAWEDFKRNNQQPVRLPNTLARRLPIRLLTESEYDAIWRSNGPYCGWMRYNTLFPNAKGLYTLSRVGFSKDGKTAVVSMTEIANHPDLVSLQLVVLKKEQGLWQKPRAVYGAIS